MDSKAEVADEVGDKRNDVVYARIMIDPLGPRNEHKITYS